MKVKIFKIPEPLTGQHIIFIPGRWSLFLTDSLDDIPSEAEYQTDGAKLIQPEYRFLATQLIVNQKCNLSCVYCYADAQPPNADRGPFNIIGNGPKEMTQNLAKAAIDRVVEDIIACSWPKAEFMIAGGEPTLSMDLLKMIAAYARESCQRHGIGANIGLVSNGTFSRDVRDWLINNMDFITISIDGDESNHDRQRPTIGGKGSYRRVLENARAIHESGKIILGLRMTATPYMSPELPNQVEYLSRIFPGRRIGLEPVQFCGRGCEMKAPNVAEVDELADAFIATFKRARELGITMKTSFASFKQPSEWTSYCGVDGKNFSIDPEGNVSACSRVVTVGDPMSERFHFGKFDAASGGFTIDRCKYESLLCMRAECYPDCGGCYARYNCKGDCPHIRFSKTERDPMSGPRCQFIKRFTLGLFQMQLGLR